MVGFADRSKIDIDKISVTSTTANKMETENNAALEYYAHAQEIDLELAKCVVLRASADDPHHAWDVLDFWLFVGCCCRLADSTVLLTYKDGIWSIYHIGLHVAQRCGELVVSCKLDNITNKVRNSFQHPEELQRVLDLHNAPDRRQYINHKHLTGFHAPPETLEAPVYFRGLNVEAWKLKIAADWAIVTGFPTGFPADATDPREYRQLLLVNLNRGLTDEELLMYERNASRCAVTTIIPFNETWRHFMAQRVKLVKRNGACRQCHADLGQCDDLLAHFISCARRCPGCQCIDHRVAQMAFCRCFDIQRKAVVLLEDGFFVLDGSRMTILNGQAAGVLMSGGICTECVLATGMRHGQSTSIHQPSFSSMISIRPMGGDEENPTTGFLIQDSGHNIIFTTTDSRCDRCGEPGRLGAPLKKCARCKAVLYCSTECQNSSWSEHRLVCRR